MDASSVGGVHVHTGTSCATAADVGDHLFFVNHTEIEIDHTSNCSWYSDPAHNYTDAEKPLK